MNITRIRTLVIVARHRSISGAAAELALVPSAVSQQVAALEQETGHRLLHRGPRGVRLTDAGIVIVEHAKHIEASIADARTALDGLRGLEGGRLRVAAFPSAARSLLACAIELFRDRHPGVELHVTAVEPPEAMADLAAGRVDLALTYDYDLVPVRPEALFHQQPLLIDPLVLVIPAAHPCGESRCTDLEAFAHDSWIVGSPDAPTTTLTLAVCRQAGFEPEVRARTDDYAVAEAWVASGVGIGLIPLLAHSPNATTALSLTTGNLSRTISVTTRRAIDNAAVAAFRDILMEHAGGALATTAR